MDILRFAPCNEIQGKNIYGDASIHSRSTSYRETDCNLIERTYKGQSQLVLHSSHRLQRGSPRNKNVTWRVELDVKVRDVENSTRLIS